MLKPRGQTKKIDISPEAEIWNPVSQSWEKVKENAQAISKVTFDFKFSNWHNGEKMDINDILHSLYFTTEWGTQTDETDKTFDTEFTPRAAQSIQTIKGIKVVDEDTIEVYVDYWHFDEGEIAGWAVMWSAIPWEITSAMEKAVIDGKVSFSRSGATNKNVNWLSLIIPNDANTIKEYLTEFKNAKHVPKSLNAESQNQEYFQNRYDSSITWIEEKQHAVISNGPFYLETYSPESRTIKLSAFEDETYPFKAGAWKEFENVTFPIIEDIEMEKNIQHGNEIVISVETKNTDEILYFLTNSKGEKIVSTSQKVQEGVSIIKIPSSDAKKLDIGSNSIKIFAVSNSVLKPDYYKSAFIITENQLELPTSNSKGVQFSSNQTEYWMWIIPAIIIIAIITYLKKRN